MSDFLIDDRITVSERIDHMTTEELDQEIERLEKKHRLEKEKRSNGLQS